MLRVTSVAAFLMMIRALGTTAPDVSATVPESVPPATCACSQVDVAMLSAKTTSEKQPRELLRPQARSAWLGLFFVSGPRRLFILPPSLQSRRAFKNFGFAYNHRRNASQA